jgi:hypothetical protein
MTHLYRRSLLVTLAAVVALGVVAASAPARTAAVPRPTGEPRITGTKEVGRNLTVSNGAWANKPTRFTYQWFRCDNPGKTNCQPIPGATAGRYRLGPDDAGHTIYASVTACNAEGCGTDASDPVGPISAANAPANTAAPSIAGTPRVGQVLTAVEGTWANTPTSYAYQWLRCDNTGNNCGAIANAVAKTYTVVAGDAASTLRVSVTAGNPKGSGTATSGQTPVVAAVSGGGGGSAVPVSQVSLPNRLLVQQAKFRPAVLHSRAPFTARFRVVDTQGRPIAGALVYILGLPYGWVRSAPEVATGADGWATLTLSPTSALPRRSSIVIFVRARKPGDSLLAGVSTRRLVQVTASF